MSASDFTINATAREESGKGASRRLRREQGLVPAIVYGGRKKPQNISVNFYEFIRHLDNEAFYSHIITLKIDGNDEEVILKDLQRHPAKVDLYHADFLRVSKTKKFTTKVPLHFINADSSIGVKTQGGTVSHNISDLEISCLPGDLPEYIEVDLAELELGHSLHISDLKLPKGVDSVALALGPDHDLPVANIHKPKGIAVESDDEGESDSDSDSSEEGAE